MAPRKGLTEAKGAAPQQETPTRGSPGLLGAVMLLCRVMLNATTNNVGATGSFLTKSQN